MKHLGEQKANERFGVYNKSEDETNYFFNEKNIGNVDWRGSPQEYVDQIRKQLKEKGLLSPLVPDDILGFLDIAVQALFGLEVNRVNFQGDCEIWFLDKKA